jgi:hypothetical protein
MYNRLAYLVRNNKKKLPKKILILPYLHERRIYLNRRHDANHFYTILSQNDIKFILCIVFQDNKMYVYSETGILMQRILYTEFTEKYGKPCSISEDGMNLIFRHNEFDEELHVMKVDVEQKQGFKWIKTINIRL